MASPFQQQSLRRKLIYAGVILVLFCGTLAMRTTRGFGMEAQAEDLQLRDLDRGEVELGGTALRLSLSGARGAAVCWLWWKATEKQKKHEWNELELLTRSLTKLQPYFITPWLFQSWNLAYNVSVESDRIKDKYFYITRGIDLLAQGERQNKNNPDLRFTMGFYIQHKIGLSDEANTSRSLFQMSCIDPAKRDPKRFRGGDKGDSQVVDLEKFEQFCNENPMLVRRLRESLKKETPADIVDFLEDNQRIPSRYEDKPAAGVGTEAVYKLKPSTDRFPILPPTDPSGKRSVNEDAPDFDNFQAAREWYAYSNEPLPEPDKELGPNPIPKGFDRKKHRMPRYMMVQIFRGYPSRGQSYVADYLEREGWFDEGWKITGNWFPDDKFPSGQEAVVGKGNWATSAWEKTRDMWRTHGEALGLYLTPEELNTLETRAAKFRKRFHLDKFATPTNLTMEMLDPEMQEAAVAHSRLYWYETFQSTTNFSHFYAQALVEADPKAVQVRKAFFQAEQLRKAADREQAMQVYQEAFPQWAKILQSSETFQKDQTQQEDTYELVLRYLDLVYEQRGKQMKQLLILEDYLTHVASTPFSPGVWAPGPYYAKGVEMQFVTALDGLISPEAIMTVRSRFGKPVPKQLPSGAPEMMMPQQSAQSPESGRQ